MKITIEASDLEDFHNQIKLFFGDNQRTAVVEKKQRKSKSVATEENESEVFPLANHSITMTPIEVAIAERSEELNKAVPVLSPIAPTATLTYEDLSKAVMAKVKVKGKADALAVLRKFKHKNGSENPVNSAMDIAMPDYATCIAELSK